MVDKRPMQFFCTSKVNYRIEEAETKGLPPRYFIDGHITTGDEDILQDIVTEDCMDDIEKQLSGRVIKLDIEHEALLGGTELERKINLTKTPIGKIVKKGRDKKGVPVEAEINAAHPRFNEIWGSVQNGFIDAFSIAYIPVKAVSKTVGTKTVRLLDKILLINVALTGNPVNPKASIMQAFTKSLDELKEIEGAEDVDVNEPIEIIQMSNNAAIEIKGQNFAEYKEAKDIEDMEAANSEEMKNLKTGFEQLKSSHEELKSKFDIFLKSYESKCSASDKEDEKEKEGKSINSEVKSLVETFKAELKAISEKVDKIATEPQLKAIMEAAKSDQEKSSNEMAKLF